MSTKSTWLGVAGLASVLSSTLLLAPLLSACSSTPPALNFSSPLTTSSLPATTTTGAKQPFAKPVTVGQAKQMYVWSAFKESDCSPAPAILTVIVPPTKGQVELKPNESMVVQFSKSGKCVGQSVNGTGIYYTASPGARGMDHFEVQAMTASGASASKAFRVDITP